MSIGIVQTPFLFFVPLFLPFAPDDLASQLLGNRLCLLCATNTPFLLPPAIISSSALINCSFPLLSFYSLMYYHYAFRLPKMFRPIITVAQIVQLVLGTLSWGVNYEWCSEYEGMRENSPMSYWSLWAFVPVFAVFFIRFFFQTYIAPAKRAEVKTD